MSDFAGAYGDKRRAVSMARLYEGIVEQSSLVIRKVGITRAGELAAHRLLSSPSVTPEETLHCVTRRTAQAVAGRRIVAAQDTTEVNFPGRQSRGLGPAGNRDTTYEPAPGFFIHATVAVDADEDALLGLVDAEIWTRDAAPPAERRARAFDDKESQRWLRAAETAGNRLAAASDIIVVGDRESDIYALFSRRPDNVQLLVRAAQNRKLDDGTMLFAAADDWPVLSAYTVQVPKRGPGDAGRAAKVVVRADRVALRHPRNAPREGDPACLEVTLVDAREIDPPPGIEPLHWRLLSTLPAQTAAEAEEMVRLYRLRWRIEQTFRMLKTHGLCLEDVQTAEPHRLFNLAALAAGAAVRIIQLVDARDGSSRPASDVASAEQIAAAAAVCPGLEGKTERQRNPHAPGSLPWMSWIIARLGGWNCYYKPPGPKTMRDGWQRFAAIAEGFELARQGQNV
jgi:IS4 transposase